MTSPSPMDPRNELLDGLLVARQALDSIADSIAALADPSDPPPMLLSKLHDASRRVEQLEARALET